MIVTSPSEACLPCSAYLEWLLIHCKVCMKCCLCITSHARKEKAKTLFNHQMHLREYKWQITLLTDRNFLNQIFHCSNLTEKIGTSSNNKIINFMVNQYIIYQTLQCCILVESVITFFDRFHLVSGQTSSAIHGLKYLMLPVVGIYFPVVFQKFLTVLGQYLFPKVLAAMDLYVPALKMCFSHFKVATLKLLLSNFFRYFNV